MQQSPYLVDLQRRKQILKHRRNELQLQPLATEPVEHEQRWMMELLGVHVVSLEGGQDIATQAVGEEFEGEGRPVSRAHHAHVRPHVRLGERDEVGDGEVPGHGLEVFEHVAATNLRSKK